MPFTNINHSALAASSQASRYKLLPLEEHKRRLKRLKAMKPPVPLFKQMEGKFIEEQILPEQEKIRNLIELKKAQAKSISLNELKDH